MSLNVDEVPVPMLNEILTLGLTAPENIFPAMMVTIGSGISFLKVRQELYYRMQIAVQIYSVGCTFIP